MFDYIVIGGGAAGCVLASRLSEDPQTRVCLLEAGPADRSVFIHVPAGYAASVKFGLNNWSFETVPQPGLNGRRGYQPRGKVLGGSTSINTMIYFRGLPSDYDEWVTAGNPGWGWADVLPIFKRSEHNERGPGEWRGSGGPLNVMDLQSPNPASRRFVQAGQQAGFPLNTDFNGPSAEGVGLYQVMQRGGERFSTAKAYLTPHIGRRANLEVRTGAHVLRVVFEGRRAVGVEVLQDGQRQVLNVRREVLLCAGALQSPQILLVSGVGHGDQLRALGIGTIHHLPGVGRHLHDHIDVAIAVAAPGAQELMGLSPGGVWDILKGALQWRRERRGLLTSNLGEAGGFVRSAPDEPVPDLQFHFGPIKVVNHARTTLLGRGFVCHICVLQPRSRGTLSLSSPDPLSPPAIDPAFLTDDGDVVRLVRGVKLTRRVLQQPSLAELGGRELATSRHAHSDEQIEQFVRNHADTLYHPVGSCRMGPGPDDVVDSRLRVHGLGGLRVVDASIMPRIISGNTTAPTIMIAEKAADMIREDAKAAA